MLTRNRGREEVVWRGKQMECQREQRKRQVEGESERFSSCQLLLKRLGALADAMRDVPGRCQSAGIAGRKNSISKCGSMPSVSGKVPVSTFQSVRVSQ